MSTPRIARGDVWQVDLNPVIGNVQAKRRPCVVVQGDFANAISPTTIICPLTTARASQGNLLNVIVRAPEAGLRTDRLVICNQIRAVDRMRFLGKKLGVVSETTIALIEQGIRAILDFDD